jgi:excisionase family DNA binding protein
MPEELLTVPEAARVLGLSEVTVYRYCKRGLFPNAQVVGAGRRAMWVIPRQDLDNLERPRPGRPKREP